MSEVQKSKRKRQSPSVKGVLEQKPPLDMGRISELLEKAEQLDQKYTDYQVKIRVGEEKAKGYQARSKETEARLA